MRFRGALLAATVLAAPIAVQRAALQRRLYRRGRRLQLPSRHRRAAVSARSGTPELKLRATAVSPGSAASATASATASGSKLEGNYRQTQARRITGTGFPRPSRRARSRTTARWSMRCSTWISACPGSILISASGAGYGWTNLNKVYAAGTNFPFSAARQRHGRRLRLAGDRRALLPDPQRAGPLAHRRIPLLQHHRTRGVQGVNRVTAARPCGLRQRQFRSAQPVQSAACCSASATPSTSRRPRRAGARAGRRPGAGAGPLLPRVLRLGPRDLTDRARQIIREAAENSTRVQYTRIEVNGYTDTSGTPRTTSACRSGAPRRSPPNW